MPCTIAPMDSSLACYEGKLVYVANLRVPSEKAHVLQSFKMCEAFRRLGLDVELTYPRRRNTSAMETEHESPEIFGDICTYDFEREGMYQYVVMSEDPDQGEHLRAADAMAMQDEVASLVASSIKDGCHQL